MIRQTYQPLEHVSVGAADKVTLCDPSQVASLGADSPALEAMTDLRQINPISTSPHSSLEEARTTMLVSGVKLLFVRDEKGDFKGLVTATDLAGERVILAASQSGTTVPELTVQEIMAKLPQLEVLDFNAVVSAELGHITASLRACGRQHALVVNRQKRQWQVVGLFSSTEIARRMGITVLDPIKATTFSEIREAVSNQ